MASESAIKAGGAFVELFTRDTLLERGLRAARKKVQAFASGLKNLGFSAVGLGASLAAPFAVAIREASQLQETMNKFDVVFGNNRQAVKEWGDNYAKQVGRSKQQIADFLASTQDLFVPLGFDPREATELSKQVTQLSVDLASFNNKLDADTLRDLQAALTGSGEVMKKYGVVLDEAGVKQELFNQGIDPQTATNQQKAYARFQIILRGTTAAQGDAIRSAGSFANQMKAMQASVSNAAASIGQALIPVLIPVVEHVVKIVEGISMWARENPELVTTLAAVAAGITAFGLAMIVLGGVASGVSTALTLLLGIISLLKGAIVLLVSPVGLIVGGLTGLAAWFLKSTEAGQNFLGTLASGFASIKADALEAFGGIKDALAVGNMGLAMQILVAFLKVQWRKFVVYLTTNWAGFVDFFFQAIDSVKAAWNSVKDAFVAIGGFLKSVWTSVVEFVVKIWNGLIDILEEGWNRFAGFINRQMDKLPDTLDPGFRIATLDFGKAKVDTSGGGEAVETPAQKSRREKAEADLAEARKEFNDLILKAAKARAEAAEKTPKEKLPVQKQVTQAAKAAVETASQSVGTFSATVANRTAFDTQQIPRLQLKAQNQTNAKLDRIHAELRDNPLVWGS